MTNILLAGLTPPSVDTVMGFPVFFPYVIFSFWLVNTIIFILLVIYPMVIVHTHTYIYIIIYIYVNLHTIYIYTYNIYIYTYIAIFNLPTYW